MAVFGVEQAKAILDNGISQAQELIQEPSKVTDLLEQFEEKLKEIPGIGESLSNIPLMISMVKCYITKEYTEVSPKVIALLVSGFIYLIKKKDLISDGIPVVGYADDMAVLGLALKMCEPELEAFKAWREARGE